MPESIQAVLFDYGLVLTGPPDPAAWQTMQQITGFAEPVLTSAYWSPRHDYDRGHLSGREYWRAVGSHAGTQLHEEQLDRLIAADNALWTQPNQPMIAWAQRLQAAGTPTGILSNLGDEMMHGVLAAFDWMGAFHHRTWSHTLRMAKPEPAIYHHSAAGLNVPIAQILFVDDREDNIAGARAAGMQAIRYTGHEEFIRSMRERGLEELWESGRTAS